MYYKRVNFFRTGSKRYKKIWPMLAGGAVLFLIYLVVFAAPFNFPSDSLVRIPRGMTLEQAGNMLKAKHLINSVRLFVSIARVFGGEGQLIAGEYYFKGPQSVYTVALRLSEGDYALEPIKVSIPDGVSSHEIAQILSSKLPDFDTKAFLSLAKPKEGRLFPDTYFFLPGEDPDLIVATFVNNFNTHVLSTDVSLTINLSGHSLSDVLTMASILQKEASKIEDQRIIAGILWKRIALGMPLQVDAVFPYIIGKNSYQLTSKDLRTDSPYNTYLYKGLPPGPISNPNVDAILAAATPVKSNYLFYLSDSKGKFHFASTYEQHLENKRKYIGG